MSAPAPSPARLWRRRFGSGLLRRRRLGSVRLRRGRPRHPRLGRLLVLVLAMGAAALALPAPAGAEQSPPAAAPQRIAELLVNHEVFAAVRGHHRIAVLPARAPITGGPTVVPVTDSVATAAGVRWLRVRVPGRPNGRQGWIQQRGTRIATTRWQLVVRTSARRVLAYRDGRLVRTLTAIVGKPSTPTPHGNFFVEESVKVPTGSPGGPFALALSARSNVLQDFDGGPGQIGIHGVRDLGGTPGTAVSHGCIRLADADIRWLAARIRPGVTVTIM